MVEGARRATGTIPCPRLSDAGIKSSKEQCASMRRSCHVLGEEKNSANLEESSTLPGLRAFELEIPAYLESLAMSAEKPWYSEDSCKYDAPCVRGLRRVRD